MQYTMTAGELQARAAQRASDEHIHIFKVAGVADLYTTKSKSDGSQRYFLSITGGYIGCACRGFEYRKSCKHALALAKRAAREGIAARLPEPVAAKPAAAVDDCVADLYPCECSRCKR